MWSSAIRQHNNKFKKMAANFEDLVSIDNPVFRSYAFWSLILVVKMLLMAPLTGRMRFKTKVCILLSIK